MTLAFSEELHMWYGGRTQHPQLERNAVKSRLTRIQLCNFT